MTNRTFAVVVVDDWSLRAGVGGCIDGGRMSFSNNAVEDGTGSGIMSFWNDAVGCSNGRGRMSFGVRALTSLLPERGVSLRRVVLSACVLFIEGAREGAREGPLR